MTTTKDSAASEAERILHGIWAELAGGVRIPVDPVRICRGLGIDVFDADLPASVSGSISKSYGQDPVILLNKSDSDNRKRFTCAHELGHYVQRSAEPDNYEYIDRRDQLASAGVNDQEVFANEFAASLLMPKDRVKQAFKQASSVVELAWRYRVSQDAMNYRLKNLGLKVG